MPRGSFNGLYTFEEVAKIYGMSHSNIRKMVQADRFIENKEIKKFGKTWVITEEAVRKHFGNNIDMYFEHMKLAELQSLREKKIQSKIDKGLYQSKGRKSSSKKDSFDLSASDDLGQVDNLEYKEVDQRSVLSSFIFE